MRVSGDAVQASRGEKHSPPATLSRMELPIVYQRRATQGTRQRIPDFAGGNRLVHGCEQNTIVGHDVAERCRSAQPIQSRATRQRRTTEDGPGWIVISNIRFVCHRRFLVHESGHGSDPLVEAILVEHACVLSPVQSVFIPAGVRYSLRQRLNDVHVSDFELVACDVSVLSLSENAAWKCCVQWCEYADGYDGHE